VLVNRPIIGYGNVLRNCRLIIPLLGGVGVGKSLKSNDLKAMYVAKNKGSGI
jgi:pantothenate kinase